MLRRVMPAEGGSIDLDAPDARTTLLDWYTPLSPEYVRLNLVATLDGRAAGPDGTSETLTSRADRTILGVIRELADVVVVGAESVRREGYLRPRSATLAIVSASGTLDGHRLLEQSDRTTPIVIITTPQGAARVATAVPDATVVALESSDEGRIEPAAIIATLRSLGYSRIVAEGGPTLAAQLVHASLVDELCLTLMPRIGGPALALLGSADSRVSPASVVQLIVDDSGAQFGRWAVQP